MHTTPYKEHSRIVIGCCKEIDRVELELDVEGARGPVVWRKRVIPVVFLNWSILININKLLIVV